MKMMIDFQEAIVELDADFIHTAYAEHEGKLWKMKKNKYGQIGFYVKLDDKFYIQMPKPKLYLIKWQPVRDK